MKENIIYIQDDEEITSVVDRLVRASTKEVFLVLPKKSVITQSLVNLKLLKREADNLGKIVTIITQEPGVQRLAKKINFLVRDSWPQSEALPEEEQEILKEPMKADEFEDLLKKEKRAGPLKMIDIVKGGSPPLAKIVAQKTKEISPAPTKPLFKVEKIKKPSAGPKIKTSLQSKQLPEFLKEEQEVVQSAEVSQPENYNLAPWPDEYREPETENRISKLKEILVPSFSIKIFGLFIISALVITGLLLYFILPKAEINISVKKDNIMIDSQVLADKAASRIDLGLNKIPAQLIRLEDRLTVEFPTTGERQLNEKAKGIITVFNAYSSNPQSLVETTRFVSPDEKIFRLTKTITIPGAKIEEGTIIPSSIEVEVEADEPGADYNIGPTNFTIPGFKGSPKYNGFYGKSTKPMTGGSTEKARILTQEDFDKNKDVVWQGLQEKIDQELVGQIPEGFVFLPEAVEKEILEAKPSIEIGSKGESFNLAIKGVAKVLIFSQADISQLVKNNFLDELNDRKQLASDTQLKYNNVKPMLDKGQMTFKVEGEQEVIWKIDEQEIKELIAGKSENEVRQIFSQRSEIEQAQVSLWPFWLKKIPSQMNKIKITVD